MTRQELEALRTEIEGIEAPAPAAATSSSATVATAEELEARARRLGDEHLVYRARLAQADILIRGGRSAAGGRIAREVHRIAEARGDTYLVARSALVLARFFRYLGDQQGVLENSVRALELMPDDVPPLIRYDFELGLGIAFAMMKSYDSARRQFQRMLSVAEELGIDEFRAAVYNNLAYSEHEAGEHDSALRNAERMRDLVARSGQTMPPTWVDTLGRVYWAAGRLDEARQVLLSANDPEVIARAADGDALASCQLSLAEVLRDLGELDEAFVVLERCLELSADQRLHKIHAGAQLGMAMLLAQQGRWQQAFERHVAYHEEWTRVTAAERDAHARIIQAVYETTEAREESERYRELSMQDPLTGLANRRYVQERLPALLGEGNREGQPLAVALVDLDHFKQINDTYSHEVGDQVLVALGEILLDQTSDGFAARMGGEEFLVVLPAASLEAAALTCERLRASIEAYDWGSVAAGLTVTASLGLAVSGPERQLPDQLLRAADAALYAAKRGGRNRVAAAPD